MLVFYFVKEKFSILLYNYSTKSFGFFLIVFNHYYYYFFFLKRGLRQTELQRLKLFLSLHYHTIWSKAVQTLGIFWGFHISLKKKMLILGGFPPFYNIVVYHKRNYINYYPFFSIMFIFFIKYISSWCLEPLLLFVFTDGWLLEIREWDFLKTFFYFLLPVLALFLFIIN